MAVEQINLQRIKELVGERHCLAGFEYPENGLQPYYQWLMQTIHMLGDTSAGWLQVHKDDSGVMQVIVMPGRVTIDGVVYYFAGSTLDLSALNNETVYIWLCENGGQVIVQAGPSDDGWPSVSHLKLAQVNTGDGEIVDITDRRSERFMVAGPMPELIGKLPEYDLQLVYQGTTIDPSELLITLRDITGAAIETGDYLRVRICDQDGYSVAANATIAAVGSYTQVVDTITADKDLILAGTQGFYELLVTNVVAETMTLRIGPADIGCRRCGYDNSLDITHS